MVKKSEVSTTKSTAKSAVTVKQVEFVAGVQPTTAVKKNSALKIPQIHYYGTGKRKTSIAKVWLFEGKGTVIINDQPILDYIKREVLASYICSPLVTLDVGERYDVVIHTFGGGLTGQAGACRLGIARALLDLNADSKPDLKKNGLLTRDSRIKERKKYGRKRARKGFQYRKR